jgi:ATP-dependent Clp protease, protease subunit
MTLVKLPTWLQMARQLAARHRMLTGRQGFSAEVSGERGQLYIYDAIGFDYWTGGGITGKSVTDALAEVSAAGIKAVDVFINSPGGDIFEGKAIYAAIRRFEGERVVHVDGVAASAASFIAMAGDKIRTQAYATWMIHDVRGSAWSATAADARKLAEVLDLENGTFADTYAKRTGQTRADVLAWMNAETWMNAAQAKERGFTDEIAEETADEGEALAAALRDATLTLRACAR